MYNNQRYQEDRKDQSPMFSGFFMKMSDSDFIKLCMTQVITAMDQQTFIGKINILETLLSSSIGHGNYDCPDIKLYNEKLEKKEEIEVRDLCYHVETESLKASWTNDYGEKWRSDLTRLDILAEIKWRGLWKIHQKSITKRSIGYLGREECEEDCCVEQRKKQILGDEKPKPRQEKVEFRGD